jgi:hypothetical protein
MIECDFTRNRMQKQRITFIESIPLTFLLIIEIHKLNPVRAH